MPSEVERIAKLEERLDHQEAVLIELRNDIKQILVSQAKLPATICKITKRETRKAIETCKNEHKESSLFELGWKKVATIGLLIGTIVGGAIYGVVGTKTELIDTPPKINAPK